MIHEFETFLKENVDLKRAEFLEKYPHPVLFQILDDDGSPLPPKQQKAAVDSKTRRLTKDLVKTPLDTSIFVRSRGLDFEAKFTFICNKDENAGRSFIGFGQDPSSDIELNHEGVAQRHGFFKTKDRPTTLTDAGLSNEGTYIRGEKIAPRTAHNLFNHDPLSFGSSYGWVYLSSDGFYELLQACAGVQPNKEEAKA